MSIAEDFHHLGTPQKILIVGGGVLVLFFLGKALISHSSGGSGNVVPPQTQIDPAKIEQDVTGQVQGLIQQQTDATNQALADIQQKQQDAQQQFADKTQQTLDAQKQQSDQNQANMLNAFSGFQQQATQQMQQLAASQAQAQQQFTQALQQAQQQDANLIQSSINGLLSKMQTPTYYAPAPVNYGTGYSSGGGGGGGGGGATPAPSLSPGYAASHPSTVSVGGHTYATDGGSVSTNSHGDTIIHYGG